MEILYLLVNRRYTSRLPTIFTTNYFLKRKSVGRQQAIAEEAPRGEWSIDLESRVSAPLISRVYEMAQIIEIQGLDYRERVRSHRTAPG